MTGKATPGSVTLDWDVAYTYDLLGRLKTAIGEGWAVNAFTYDALGRMTNEQNYNAATLHAYDLAGRQTRLTWGDGNYVDYDYNVTGEVTAIRENGATSGAGVLAIYLYDDLGRRASVTRGNGTTTNYSYDAVSRLSALTEDLAGSSYDFTHGFTYNPAGQIGSVTRSNDAYAWTGHYNVDRPYPVNGLNQMTAAGAVGLGYDGRGNLTSSGSSAYGYTTENRMASAPGATMVYEPRGDQLLQLYNVSTGLDTRFAWSGDQMTAEYNAAGWTIMRRYVPGPDMDEPIVWYEGAGMGDRRWLHSDERGSVVAVTNASGNAIGVNRYDEYGIPAATNIGRFQYTGQAWLPEIGMYYYKARIYSPTLGRFMQTDPIGYDDGLNLYAYVGNDPVNATDPSGLARTPEIPIITVTGTRLPGQPRQQSRGPSLGGIGGAVAGSPSGAEAAAAKIIARLEAQDEIVVTATRPPPTTTPAPPPAVSPPPAAAQDGDNEHTKNARPSTQEKHEKGKAAKRKARGGEKGDARRRPPRVRPKGWRGSWPRLGPLIILPEWMLHVCIIPDNSPKCTTASLQPRHMPGVSRSLDIRYRPRILERSNA